MPGQHNHRAFECRNALIAKMPGNDSNYRIKSRIAAAIQCESNMERQITFKISRTAYGLMIKQPITNRKESYGYDYL